MKCFACTFDSPPGMNFCGRCGAPLGTATPPPPPRPAPPLLTDTAEHRQLTVMFCDLVGSTALAEKLDPEALRQVVLAYQEVASEVVERFDGHVAQLLGDGLLVYFGYPLAHEDDPRRAVHAALDIVEAIAELNERRQPAPDFDLAVRLGIHTGLVVTGDLGGSGRREHLAVGQTPNVAARLQGLAEPGGIVLSGSTHALVDGLFAFRPLGPQKLKGVSEPVDVYAVLAETGVPERFQAAVQKGLPPLVGRREELALLRRKFSEACDGRPRLALLTGEAGFGKSRLAHELKLCLADEPQPWWTCYCSPYHQNSALHPLIELVRQLFQISREDPPPLKLAKLEEGLEERGAPLAEAIPLYASLLSLPLPAAYEASGYSPQREKERTLEILHYEVLRQAGDAPLVFMVENLQWADPSTLQFLELLLQGDSTARLLILITCRPDFHPPWTPRPGDLEIAVDRLSEEQVIEVTHHWTGGKPLPRAVLRQVVDKTDGVPLFVEELTKTILESGILVEGETAYELAGPLPALAIPSTLQDSLRARLDRLPLRVKEVAQVGAVVGRKFTFELLDLVSPRSSQDLAQALDHLVQAELLLHGGALPASTFRFKHVMIQEATYGSLLKRQRGLYHQRIAEALESHFPGVCETDPEVVAHHFTEAGQHERGLDYWLLAGQKAFRHSAILEAQAHLDQGLRLLATLPAGVERDRRELALQAVLGAALSTVKGFAAPEVNQAYGRALEICQQSGDAPELFWVMWGLWRFRFVRADLKDALALGHRLIRLAEPKQDTAMRIAAYFTVGATLYCQGEVVAAHDYFEKAIGWDSRDRQQHYAAQTGEDSGVASLIWDAWCLWFMGYPERARRRGDEATALARRVAHPFSLTYSLVGGGFLSYYHLDPASVLEQAEEVLAQSLEQGSWWAIPAPIFLGWAQAMTDDPDASPEDGALTRSGDAMSSIRQGIEGHQATGARLHRSQYLLMLAEVSARQGHLEDAGRSLEDALAAVRETGERFFEAEIHRLRGELELLADAGGKAARSFQRALGVAREQGARALELRAAVSLGRLWLGQGRQREARELLAPVLSAFTEGSETTDLRQARALLDDVSRALGPP